MTTLVSDRDTLLRERPAKALIVTGMTIQGIALQRELHDLGWPAALADGADLGLSYLESGNFDLVIIDVDMGYPVVDALVRGLRTRHPASRVAIMLGWWDCRDADMQPLSDLVIYKPVHPDQLRQALLSIPTLERLA